MDTQEIYSALSHALGDKVKSDSEILKEYQDDMTEIPGKLPDLLVQANSQEDVLKVVEIAQSHKIPIIPVVAKTNLGGLAIPEKGGIILDLKGMNRIIEVNEEDMYMVIEPGVTFADVKEHLDRHFPNLRFSYPLSPPYTSVLANSLLDGLGNLSFKHGSMGEWVNGVEAVLANGDIIKTGSGAYSSFWCSNSPLPDLTGLFLNFQATTGIVTKLSVQLVPQPKLRKRFFILAYDIDNAYSLIKRLSRENLWDDIGGLSWPLGKMLFDVKYPKFKDPDEPLIFIFVDMSSNYEKEMALKQEILNDILEEYKLKGAHFEEPFDIEVLIKINPAFAKFTEMPTTLDFLIDHGGGGLTWVGTYGPVSQWEKGIKKGMEILETFDFPPILVSRPMKGGHFAVLRFIILFDKSNADEVEKVRECNLQLVKAVLELGFIPYKTPPWVVKIMKDKLDPGFSKYLTKIQKLMDPNGIMNPGKWSL